MRKVVLCAVGLACIGLLVMSYMWFMPARPHGASYFVPVVDGQLYRSRQPNEPDWAWLQKNLHLRTVIDLRDPTEKDPLLQVEPGETARLGIRHISMPIHHYIPTTQQVDEFLATVKDPANQPVLIHCELGRQRTGVMVAIYRMEVQGWPAKKAYDEMLTYFKRNELGIAKVTDFLLKYQPGVGNRPSTP